jgi:cell division septation protein DedD
MYRKLLTGRAVNGMLHSGSVVFFMMVFYVSAGAQEALEAYDRGSFYEAFSLLREDSVDSNEVDFLRAAMVTDADSAVQIYQKIVLRAPESEVARRAIERIRQYYYAQGLYSRAEELKSTLGDWQPPRKSLRSAESTPPPPISMNYEELAKREDPKPELVPAAEPVIEQPEVEEPVSSAFSLQVGAFGSSANANTLKSLLEEAGYSIIILTPEENATNLHMVRVVGFDTINDAFKAAEEIQSKFNIQPIVVPGD